MRWEKEDTLYELDMILAATTPAFGVSTSPLP